MDVGPALPPAVRRRVATTDARVVRRNEAGGVTWEVGAGTATHYVKWSPGSSGVDLGDEAVRLRWAAAFHPVPDVVAEGRDDGGSWMVTAGLGGENAVAPRWLAEPARAVVALGAGLRALHDALPVRGCPFDWSTGARAADARRRAEAGLLHPRRWHEEHQSLSVTRALEIADDQPPVDQLVVCQGDACAPNTLLRADGTWSGHVDLGSLGVADRWADLAVATWSTTWNYGPGWEGALLAAYGVVPDPRRTAYYRLLWDLGP